jgi:hypothetical protein
VCLGYKAEDRDAGKKINHLLLTFFGINKVREIPILLMKAKVSMEVDVPKQHTQDFATTNAKLFESGSKQNWWLAPWFLTWLQLAAH